MKKTVKKPLSLILSLLLILSVCPIVAFGYDATHIATPEGVRYENETFTEEVIIGTESTGNECFIEFDNCVFSKGITVINSDSIGVEFHANCNINGTVNVVPGDDREITDMFVNLFFLPDGATVNSDDYVNTTLIGPSAYTYTLNGIEIIGTSDPIDTLYIQSKPSIDDYCFYRNISINNASAISIAENSYDRYNIDTLNENNTTVSIEDSDWEDYPYQIEFNASNTVYYGCTCAGNEACTCTCCQELGSMGDSCSYTCRPIIYESYAACECRNPTNEDIVPGKVIFSGAPCIEYLVFTGDVDMKCTPCQVQF